MNIAHPQEVVVHSELKGWAALYGGLKPNLVATTISQGLYFYIYSALRTVVVSAEVASN